MSAALEKMYSDSLSASCEDESKFNLPNKLAFLDKQTNANVQADFSPVRRNPSDYSDQSEHKQNPSARKTILQIQRSFK